MSLTAIIYRHIQDMNLWTSSTLNNILTIGNNLYISIRCSVRTNDYLLLTDVPHIVSICNKVYILEYSESLTESLFLTSNNGPYMTLQNSLTEVFSNCQLNYHCCLLTIGINTVAVFKDSEQSFKIFDAHSRDLHEMPHSFGKCTLLTIEGIENLVSYLQISCLQIRVVPFEIKGVFVRNIEPDLHNVNESPKIGRLPFNNKRNQMQPIKRKLKSLTETPEEKEKRLIVRREYEKRRTVNESEESKEKRLAQQCLKRKKKRANESSESRKKRLATQSQYQRQKIANESAEFREERLLNQRHYQNKKISNESAECREKRLLNQHQYQNKRIANESAECREERLLNQRQYQKEKLANESADHRQERLAKRRQYQKEKNLYNSTITDEIRKFHANISRGPEYICSCCNQLWYKHSVITAEKLRLPNSTAGKYLLSKTSVDGIEWICQSCYKYLKKDKIQPCAAKNGMSFPAKPDFFYLNELECRMLAPRLAFEKLLQAPRGNQFKIKGNVLNVPAEVNNTVNMLPRLPQESGTIKVQLKR